MPRFSRSSKSFILTVFAWTFFSFAALKLTSLFSVSAVLQMVVFNALAIGYIFYHAIVLKEFPTIKTYCFSLIGFHLMIAGLDFLYAWIVLIDHDTAWLYKATFYLTTNAFFSTIGYLILQQTVKGVISKYK